MKSSSDKAATIIQMAPLLSGRLFNDVFDHVLQFEDEGIKSATLAAICHQKNPTIINKIFQIWESLSKPDAKILLLEALAGFLDRRQISLSIEFIVSMGPLKRKHNILKAISPNLTRQQINYILKYIKVNSNKFAYITASSSILDMMTPRTKAKFLNSALEIMNSRENTNDPVAMALAVSSIVSSLEPTLAENLLSGVLHNIYSMSGNRAGYPGGNPKTNALKSIFPYLTDVLQYSVLKEATNIPDLMTFSSSAFVEILAEKGLFCSSTIIADVVFLLGNEPDTWYKVKALENLWVKASDEDKKSLIEIASSIKDDWMRAYGLSKMYSDNIENLELLVTSRKTLLNCLWNSKMYTRNDFLWSVSNGFFGKSLIDDDTLYSMALGIIDICEAWDWNPME